MVKKTTPTKENKYANKSEKNEPSEQTLNLIRQFARSSHYEKKIPHCFGEMCLN